MRTSLGRHVVEIWTRLSRDDVLRFTEPELGPAPIAAPTERGERGAGTAAPPPPLGTHRWGVATVAAEAALDASYGSGPDIQATRGLERRVVMRTVASTDGRPSDFALAARGAEGADGEAYVESNVHSKLFVNRDC